MKITIIGNNPNITKFLGEVEIIDNYLEADLVIFCGDINWRSATTKFNKLNKNQKVVAFGKCTEFINRRYGIRSVGVKMFLNNRTIDVFDDITCRVYQGVIDITQYAILNEDYFYGGVSKDNCQFDHFSDADANYIRAHRIPVIYRLTLHDKPISWCINLDVNKFSNSEISQYIKDLICA